MNEWWFIECFYSRVTTSYPEEKRTVITRQSEVQDLWEIVKVPFFDIHQEKRTKNQKSKRDIEMNELKENTNKRPTKYINE